MWGDHPETVNNKFYLQIYEPVFLKPFIYLLNC